MSNISFSENVPDTNNDQHVLKESHKLNIPLQDSDNHDHPSSSSQLRSLPPRHPSEHPKSPAQSSSLAFSQVSQQEGQRELIRPRPLFRKSSNTPSRRHESQLENDNRPLSGLSAGTRWDSKKRGAKRISTKTALLSPSKSALTNQSRSIGRPDDSSVDTQSFSYSGLHHIHQMYQDIGENGSRIPGSGYGTPYRNKKKSLANKVKDTYYRLLRKRFKRRNSYVHPDTQEFDEQMETIKENIRIPNDERIADLKLEEMTRLERVEKYSDDLPFLQQRKSFMRLLCRISITSNYIITHPIFDLLIIVVIIVNSIFLALDDPTSQVDTLSRVDNYFLGIYTAEMLLKIFGMGFILPRNSYLRDPWNILDFAIVVTSYLTIALTSVNLNLRALRSLRVLRPLKTISNIEGLRVIILTLLAALKPLLETFFILFFLFLIFAIAGLQLFSGSLKKRCFSLDYGVVMPNSDENDNNYQQYCNSDSDCSTVNGLVYICGKMLANPNYGSTNFDSIGSALLFTFQIVTMEGWSDVMRDLQKTFSPLAAIYFFLLVLIGGFVLLNLTLAVIKAEFTAHSHMSIKARRMKKPTYDERLIKKLDENKIDVINLIKKYNTGETLYKKYQFKKDQLIAIENSKRRRSSPIKDKHGNEKFPTRRRNAITRSVTDLGPAVMIKGVFGKLKSLLFSRQSSFSQKRFSKINSLNPDTRTELPGSLQDLGTLNHLDSRRVKGKKSTSKIFPYDSTLNSQQELVPSTSLDNLPTTNRVFTPISHKFKSFFMRFNNNNPGYTRKVTSESSSSGTIVVPEHQITPRESAGSSNKNEHNSPEHTETPDQTNVQVYKQTRGFGDLRIKITEANTPQKQPVPGADLESGYSAHPLPSSVPSVIEEQFSEDSPTKTFDNSALTNNNNRKSILPPWVRPGKRMLARMANNSPIRPIKSEKVLMGPEDSSEGNKVELINIAGIRNKRNLATTLKPQENDQLVLNTEQDLLLEEQVDDLMDDDQWFLESLKAQEAEGMPIQNRDKQRATLLKKINQIKGLTDSQRRSLMFQQAKDRDSVMRSSNRYSSAIGSEDFEGNFSRNSHSRKGGSVRNSSKGFLEDSDFQEKHRNSRSSWKSRNSRNSKSSQKSDKRTQKAKKKLTLKRGMTIREEEDAIKEENEEEEEIGMKRNEVEEEEIEDPIMSEEDVIELAQQEKHMVLDLRRLKPEPVFGREYDSYSLNDVLPSKKLNEKKRQEEDDRRRLRENRMEIVHQVTKKEEQDALERNRQKQEDMKKETTALAMKFSEKAKEVRRQLKEEQAFDAEINAALENMRSKNNNNNNRGSPAGWTKKFAFKRASVNKPANEVNLANRQLSHASQRSNGTQKSYAKRIKNEEKGEEEEELTEGQMKDFFFLLRKIQTPYNNEKEHEESEEYQKKIKAFDYEADYSKLRRKDLEENKIQLSNWSGNIVLYNTYNQFPADKVKKALNNQDWDIWRSGVMGVVHALQRKAKAFSLTSFFNGIIMMSVFLNTLILCCNGLVTSTSVNNVFNNFNTAFTIIFAIEMTIKIFGFGIIKYARDPFNLCDAAIVVLSIVETIINMEKNSASTAFRALRLFRTLRVLRVTKLLRALNFMRIILGVILRSLKRSIYILALLLLLIFIYTCLGMQIFGGQTNFDDNIGQDRIRQNFNTFADAFMTVFQVMTVENWNDVLTILYRSPVSNFISILYLVSWIFIGNYLFLNLFLALLLDEFTGEEVEEELEELEAEEEEAPIDKQISNMTRKTSQLSRKTLSKENSNLRSASSLNSQTFSLTDFDEISVAAEDEVHDAYKTLPCTTALYLFPKENPTRRFCFKISKHRYFEYGILFVIFLNCIKLILDTYIPDDATSLINASNIFNYIFVVIFVVEALIKIFSLGFVFDKGSYLRDGWNIIDFVIIVTSLIDVFFQSTNLSFFRAFRLLRALRPLRFISHNQNMRIVVNALLESIGPIFNVLIVVIIIWLMFAILAVNLVGGQFGYCSNIPSEQLYYNISKIQCEKDGYIWKDFNANFNNVFQGILTLFILSTQEDWPDIMFHMSDSNSSDTGPIENKNRLLANLYFVFFMFIGTYFLVNLFIGVIFLNFDRAQKREEFRHKFLTPNQRKWVAVQRLVLFTKPDRTIVEPTTKWMKPFFKLIVHDYFEYFMMGSIVLNIITMGLSYDDSANSYTNALTYVNYLFTAIFAAEMILKHLGLGPAKYWSSRWNRFDAFVVLASLVEVVVSALNTSVLSFLRAGPQIVRIFRVLRVSRLFKLIKRFTGLKKLINTLVFSLPSLLNVGGLLLLVYFMFAILATFLFKDVSEGDIIDDKLNFHNFLNSFIALFRASTGEDWWYIMFDTVYPQGCVNSTTTSCGSKGGIAFWLIYILLIQFIFLNLFVLIVIQQFEEYHLDPNNPVNKFREKLKLEFNPTWQILSAKHGGYQIHEKQLIPFFLSLSPPLGFRNLDMNKTEVALEITSMHLTTNSEGFVFYNDVLYACMKRVYGNEDLVGVPKYLLKQEVKVRRKLDQLKKKLQFKRSGSGITPTSSLSNYGSSVNPIFQVLLMGMTMRAWVNYSKVVAEKMKAAEENGFEYIPSESDEDDYEEYRSDESEESSPSLEDEVHDVYKDQEKPLDDEHISEEDSEEAESKDLDSDDEKPGSYQRRSSRRSSSKVDLIGSRLSRQSRQSTDNYKYVVHKEIPSLVKTPEPGEPLESADRFLHVAKLERRTPNYIISPPKREAEQDQPDSVWGGSPERISASHFKNDGGRVESTKSIFDFLDAEKLSNISPMSRRYSVNAGGDDFGTFDPNENPSNPFMISKVPTKEILDSNFLAPPALKKEMSGPLGGKRAQATVMYEKAEKDLLSIPLSLSRINSNNRGDNTTPTPKSGSSLKKFFPS